jgi:hypothetical protein
MIKLIARTVLALSIWLVLFLPASAQLANNGVSREDEEICTDTLLICVLACGIYPNDELYKSCNQDCNEDFGICVRGDLAQSTNPGQPKPPSGVHTVGVGAIGEAEVERACRTVRGNFADVANGFGCVKQMCSPKGNCTVACLGGRCYAVTPDPLPPNMTLLGILQNGSNTVRDPKGGGTPNSLSDPAPGGTAPAVAPPAVIF